MSDLLKAREFLEEVLAAYGMARSLAELETAVLGMHTGLETAFRACLRIRSGVPQEVKEAVLRPGVVSFPDLVDLVGDHTEVLGPRRSRRALLVSLNTTRARIAHPMDKPPAKEIVHDAWRLAELIGTLWPRLFEGASPPPLEPVSLSALRERRARARAEAHGAPPDPVDAKAKAEASGPSQGWPMRTLRRLWLGQRPAHGRFGRLVLAGMASTGAAAAWRGALSLARWPQPLKAVSVALVFAALALVLWAGWLLYRLFSILGGRRLLIAACGVYVLLVSIRTLTTDVGGSMGHSALVYMEDVAVGSWRTMVGLGRSLVTSPATFRFAYTARRRALDVSGVGAERTPIEADIIEPVVHTEIPTGTAPVVRPVASTPTPMDAVEDGRGLDVVSFAVSGTRGKRLRVRAGPGLSFDVVGRVPEGSELEAVEGPVEGEQYTWWRVRGEEIEGWCADPWLTPVE